MTQDCKPFSVIMLALWLYTGVHQVCAMTLDYTTNASALAGACWYDPFWGYVCPDDFKQGENTNGRSYASAYYEIQFGGEARISAEIVHYRNKVHETSHEPNIRYITAPYRIRSFHCNAPQKAWILDIYRSGQTSSWAWDIWP